MAVRTRKSTGRTGRRAFLKTVTAGAGAIAVPGAPAAGGSRPPIGKRSGTEKQSARPALEYPRALTGAQTKLISFPLGGIGAGSLGLGGRGQLRDWEIFNKPQKGNSPQYAFASIWAQHGDRPPVARILESRIQPPYEGNTGLGFANVPGLPRLESCTFTGEFPLASIAFHDPDLPVEITLEAFTPFIPLNADDSGLPVAILRYRAVNSGASKVSAAIALSIENPVGQQRVKGVRFHRVVWPFQRLQGRQRSCRLADAQSFSPGTRSAGGKFRPYGSRRGLGTLQLPARMALSPLVGGAAAVLG